MLDSYQILGVEPGADEDTIKRAYLKLVRQYSPEEDPEMFQKIRTAYEQLKEKKDENRLKLSFPKGGYADFLMKDIYSAWEQDDYDSVMDLIERLSDVLQMTDGLYYFLAESQMYLGYCGKAVKNYEKLVELRPESVHFWVSYADACHTRGFCNKAMQAYEKAYKMKGCEVDLFHGYVSLLEEKKKTTKLLKVLRELIESGSGQKKSTVAYKDYLYLLVYQSIICFKTITCQDLIYLEDAIVKNGKANKDDKEWNIAIYTMMLELSNSDRTKPKTKKQVDRILELLKDYVADKQEEVRDELRQLELLLIYQNIDDAYFLRFAHCSSVLEESISEEEQQARLFLIYNYSLFLIEEWEKLKIAKKLNRMREIAKYIYQGLEPHISNLIQAMENGQKDQLKQELLEKYARNYLMYREGLYHLGGDYFEEYPKMKEMMLSSIGWDSFEDGTYIREKAKIGRNDPCPCGSGKKYKRCCGR